MRPPGPGRGLFAALFRSSVQMVFTKFVQAGRLAYITFGDEKGKVAVIADIVDQNRVILDGPTTGVRRQVMSLKRVNLAEQVLEGVARGASTTEITAALTASSAVADFEKSATGQKLAKAALRRNLTDFERFKVRQAKKARSYILKSSA